MGHTKKILKRVANARLRITVFGSNEIAMVALLES